MGSVRKIQSKIEMPFSWARALTKVGAIASSLWLVYRVGAAHGLLAATLAFAGLAIVYAMGVSPAFAVAASVVCFLYRDAGIWLPLTAYVLAAVSVLTGLKRGGSVKAEQEG